MRYDRRFKIPFHLYRTHRAYRPETRQQMIDSTNRFLSLALGSSRMPRIPRRRVDQGGFNYLERFEGMKLWCERWWFHIIDGDLLD